MKFLFLIISFLCLNAQASVLNYKDANTVKPAFDSEKNIRNKGLFNTSLGLIYQLDSLGDYTSSGYSSTVRNQNNLGFNGQFTLNLTSKAWLQVYGEGSWMLGELNNSGTYLYSGVNINYANNYSNNSNYEIKAVVGYDVLSYKSIDISIYGGVYHRGIQLSNARSENYDPTNYSVNGSVNSNINLTGAVFGTSITHYTENVISNAFLEGYLTSSYGNTASNFSGTNGGNAVSANISSNYNNAISGGFGVGLSTEVRVVKNIWIKPSAKFQMLFTDLAPNSTSSGSNAFQALTLGLGLSWR